MSEFRTFRKGLDDFVIKQFFNFMFFVGTRPSEAMALRFCDIDKNCVHIRHNIHRRGNRELDTPKNQSSIRDPYISKLTRFRLFLLKCYYNKIYGKFEDEYFVFGGEKPLSSSTIDRYKKRLVKRWIYVK